jgi:hypothetical protein
MSNEPREAAERAAVNINALYTLRRAKNEAVREEDVAAIVELEYRAALARVEGERDAALGKLAEIGDADYVLNVNATWKAAKAREDELRAKLDRACAERDEFQTLYYEAREILCSCNIVDTSKPLGDPYHIVCEWCAEHPKDMKPTFTLANRAETAEAELEKVRGERDRLRQELEDEYSADAQIREITNKNEADAAQRIATLEGALRLCVRNLQAVHDKIEDWILPGADGHTLFDNIKIAESALSERREGGR